MITSVFPKLGLTDLTDKKVHAILASVFLISLVQLPLVLEASTTIVRGDGVGYYAYLRSVLFDEDLDFRNEYDHFAAVLPGDAQPQASSFRGEHATQTGYAPNIWPIGPAILWSPFVVSGHFAARLLNGLGFNIELDGYSLPYQFAVALGSAVYAFVGLLLAYQFCRQYFNRHSSFLSVLLIWFATSLTAYMYFMPSMSHAGSFFCATLFLFLWYRTRHNRSLRMWLLLGIVAGLMTLQRLQDSLFAFVIGIELLPKVTACIRRNDWNQIGKLGISFLIFLASAALMLLPQMLAWQVLYGKLLPNIQQQTMGYTFNWVAPRFTQVLFSPHHGLIAWTPLVGFGLAGLYFVWKNDRTLATMLLAAFLLQLYVVSSWQIWWQGASFGGRMFISCTVVFLIGLAGLIEWLGSRVPTQIIALGGSIFVAWNYLLLFQYGTGMIPREESVSWLQIVQNAARVPLMIVQMILQK